MPRLQAPCWYLVLVQHALVSSNVFKSLAVCLAQCRPAGPKGWQTCWTQLCLSVSWFHRMESRSPSCDSFNLSSLCVCLAFFFLELVWIDAPTGWDPQEQSPYTYTYYTCCVLHLISCVGLGVLRWNTKLYLHFMYWMSTVCLVGTVNEAF